MTEAEREQFKAEIKHEIKHEIQRGITLAFMSATHDMDTAIMERTERGIIPSGIDPAADLFLILSNLTQYVRREW